MRARIHDAAGPRWTRLVVPLLGGLGVAGGLAWWRADGAPIGADFFFSLALLAAAPLLLARHAPRPAKLLLRPGRVRVRQAGLLTQTLRARELVGASATACNGKLTLALMRARRDAPTILELGDEHDLEAVREALGVGRFGFGTLGFHTRPRQVDRLRGAARVAAVGASLLLAGCALFGVNAGPLLHLAAYYLLFLFPAVLVWGWLRARDTRHGGRLWLTPRDVRVEDGRGAWQCVPYADVTSAVLDGSWLVLRRRGKADVCTPVRAVRHAQRGMSKAEAEHVLAQIDAATRRARGEVAPEQQTFVARALGRQDGEPARAWLERLDATACQIATSYRGAPVSQEDLWAALEDHDADPDLRAASARVLRRVAPEAARARVESVCATVRGDLARRKLRLAVEADLERASIELDEMDAVAPVEVRR